MNNMKWHILIAAAGIFATVFAGPSASAAQVQTRKVSVSTIVEFGNTVQPALIDQSNQINIARIVQFGGGGTADAAIVQDGMRNDARVFQIGDTTNSLISQLGENNTAYVRQIGHSTNSLIRQVGDLNTAGIRQFGEGN